MSMGATCMRVQPICEDIWYFGKDLYLILATTYHLSLSPDHFLKASVMPKCLHEISTNSGKNSNVMLLRIMSDQKMIMLMMMNFSMMEVMCLMQK